MSSSTGDAMKITENRLRMLSAPKHRKKYNGGASFAYAEIAKARAQKLLEKAAATSSTVVLSSSESHLKSDDKCGTGQTDVKQAGEGQTVVVDSTKKAISRLKATPQVRQSPVISSSRKLWKMPEHFVKMLKPEENTDVMEDVTSTPSKQVVSDGNSKNNTSSQSRLYASRGAGRKQTWDIFSSPKTSRKLTVNPSSTGVTVATSPPSTTQPTSITITSSATSLVSTSQHDFSSISKVKENSSMGMGCHMSPHRTKQESHSVMTSRENRNAVVAAATSSYARQNQVKVGSPAVALRRNRREATLETTSENQPATTATVSKTRQISQAKKESSSTPSPAKVVNTNKTATKPSSVMLADNPFSRFNSTGKTRTFGNATMASLQQWKNINPKKGTLSLNRTKAASSRQAHALRSGQLQKTRPQHNNTASPATTEEKVEENENLSSGKLGEQNTEKSQQAGKKNVSSRKKRVSLSAIDKLIPGGISSGSELKSHEVDYPAGGSLHQNNVLDSHCKVENSKYSPRRAVRKEQLSEKAKVIDNSQRGSITVSALQTQHSEKCTQHRMIVNSTEEYVDSLRDGQQLADESSRNSGDYDSKNHIYISSIYSDGERSTISCTPSSTDTAHGQSPHTSTRTEVDMHSDLIDNNHSTPNFQEENVDNTVSSAKVHKMENDEDEIDESASAAAIELRNARRRFRLSREAAAAAMEARKNATTCGEFSAKSTLRRMNSKESNNDSKPVTSSPQPSLRKMSSFEKKSPSPVRNDPTRRVGIIKSCVKSHFRGGAPKKSVSFSDDVKGGCDETSRTISKVSVINRSKSSPPQIEVHVPRNVEEALLFSRLRADNLQNLQNDEVSTGGGGDVTPPLTNDSSARSSRDEYLTFEKEQFIF